MPIPERFLDDPDLETGFRDLSPVDAEELVRRGKDELCLLDVRTLREHEIHRIPGATLLPLHDLPMGVPSLDPERPTLVYCEHGVRSLQAAAFLRGLGFTHVYNLRGGIVQWRGEMEGSARE